MNPNKSNPKAILDTESISDLKRAFLFFVTILTLIAVGLVVVNAIIL